MDDLTELDRIRQGIDAVDKELARLLQERAVLGLKAGTIKQRLHLPILDPNREREVLAALDAAGPLPRAALERIFKVIIRETRSLEEVHGP